jgi:hypothetical protein
MFTHDRTEPVTKQTRGPTEPASRALVPQAFTERRARRRWYRWSPDPIFITHLIAEAEQVPQARRIRRGSLAEAQAAYRPREAPTAAVGSRMRQVV